MSFRPPVFLNFDLPSEMGGVEQSLFYHMRFLFELWHGMRQRRAGLSSWICALAGMGLGMGLTPAQATPPAGYYLVWGDEFNGTSLNTNNWTYWEPGVWGNAMNVTNAVTLNGSNLVITSYTSGGTNYTAMLASQFHFHPRYGYYEANIQWSDTNGEWSAFWLRSPTMGTYLNDAFVSGGELDVCEHRYVGIYGTYIGNIVSDNIHWDGYGTGEQSSGSPNEGNVATGFHTYGLLWNLDTYSFSIDGTEDWNASGTTTPIFGSDAYILLSSQINDSSTTWAGYIPTNGYGSQSQSTTKLLVDYFRYYAPTNVLFWTGASSVYWSNSANWVSNMMPAAGSDLTFSYLGTNANSLLGANMAVDGLVFIESGTNFSIGGNNLLTLGAGGIDMVAAHENVTLNTPINVSLPQTWRMGHSTPGNLLMVNGALSGTAALTKAGYGTLVLNGTNSYSGTLNVDTGSSATNDGCVLVANAAAIANVPSPISLRNTAAAVSTLQFSNSVTIAQTINLAGRNTNVAGLDGVAGSNTLTGGLILTAGGTNYAIQAESGTLQINGSIVPNNTVTSPCFLTFQGTGAVLVTASIQNGNSSSLSLVGSGTGTTILAGVNTYTGGTTNLSGSLLVNGSISGPVVVAGGNLGGIGTVTGNVIVQGGAITPGGATSNTLGTLSIGSNLTLGVSALTTIAIDAATLANDQLNVTGMLTYGGTLQLQNLAGTFAAGQSFQIFNAGSYVGTFSTLVLPLLNDQLAWNTNNLSSGSLSIVTAPTPAFPTTAYAAAVASYKPVGYWPLQERTPAAGIVTETNLGTLGAIANAFYPDTNPADITLGAAGALASDTDLAVAFNANAQTFVFAPRASSALTLEPPFTLETWFNPSTTVYGVLLGEGGGGTLNGGPTYGGFQYAWAGNNESRFDAQLYRYGINSSTTYNTITGFSNNIWYHYVFTYDTFSNGSIYIDGQLVGSMVLPYLADTWSPFTIGNGKWTGLSAARGISGTIDEVAVYTNLLAPNDISNHYAAGINTAPAVAYKQLILNDNPLLYYRMDCPEPASAPIVLPIATNFGSAPVNGQYQAGTVPAGVTGATGNGMGSGPVGCLLNGIFSCVDAGYDSTFNPANGSPFTALIWVRGYPADGSMQALMSRGAGSWALNLDGTSGKLVWNSGAGSVTSAVIYNDGNWHQAAGVYDGVNNYLYVDGALQTSGMAIGTAAGNGNDIFLGGDPSYTTVEVNERYFAGAIAQAAFFTNALSAAQIQATYAAAVSPAPLSLSIQNVTAGQMQLSWNYGTLQSSLNANGPYTDISSAAQPYFVSATNFQCFYRVRR